MPSHLSSPSMVCSHTAGTHLSPLDHGLTKLSYSSEWVLNKTVHEFEKGVNATVIPAESSKDVKCLAGTQRARRRHALERPPSPQAGDIQNDINVVSEAPLRCNQHLAESLCIAKIFGPLHRKGWTTSTLGIQTYMDTCMRTLTCMCRFI